MFSASSQARARTKLHAVQALGYTTTFAWADPGKQLKVLDAIHSERLAQVQDVRMRRQGLLRQLRELAEGGQIAVIESGRDCDGVRYWGRRHLIEATVQAVDALHDRLANWADGPFSLALARPSEPVEYGSRDLAAEAFENGHPHVIYA